MSTLTNFRRQKDLFFERDPHSPLLPEQKDGFTGLSYYPENPDLRFEIAGEQFTEQERVTMQTNTGDVQDFLRWGQIRFEIEGEPATLTLYVSLGGGGFFLPFMDATSGDETYSAGRYLEVEPLAEGKFIVDFNMAYNPYCAYNAMWTCPIPPKENRLSVPIRAGEKLLASSR